MKITKKFFALFLAMMMAFAMGTTAFAADNGTGSITIENATIGETYEVYRVFDATVSDDGAIAYTIEETSAFFNPVNGGDSPFALAQIPETKTYNVSVKEGYDDAQVLAWLQNEVGTGTPDFKETATDTELYLSGIPFGYYLIRSNIGATVTVTNVKPNAVVHDKNQTPGWSNPEPSNPDTQYGKNVSDSLYGEYSREISASNGDEIYYSISAFAPKYNGKNIINEYIFTDEAYEGIKIDKNSVVIELSDGTTLSYGEYFVSERGNGMEIRIPVYDNFHYPDNATITIRYSATVTGIEYYDRINRASMTWTEAKPSTTNPSEPENPGDWKDPDSSDLPPDSETHTYVYGFELQKYKNSVDDANKLDGAVFKLYDSETDGNEIVVVLENGTYVVADVTQQSDGVEIKAGYAKVCGLKEGFYYLEEVKAPDGYNALTKRVRIQVGSQVAHDADGITDEEVSVVNNTGAVLPETGGIGTTIFYVVGGLLMVGAVVLLITKKKMSVSND